jgi:hypothetical protein
VAEEVGAVDSDVTVIVRCEPDGETTVMGAPTSDTSNPKWGQLDRCFAQGLVRQTGGAARFDVNAVAWERLPEIVWAEGARGWLRTAAISDVAHDPIAPWCAFRTAPRWSRSCLW